MASREVITIPLDLPHDEASAFAEMLKRTSYDDCVRRSNRNKRYSDGREEADVMWSGCVWSRANLPRRASRRGDIHQISTWIAVGSVGGYIGRPLLYAARIF
jgi:hypothetical protein